jgi:hypothetical protein
MENSSKTDVENYFSSLKKMNATNIVDNTLRQSCSHIQLVFVITAEVGIMYHLYQTLWYIRLGLKLSQ